jgi:hypothetical protein
MGQQVAKAASATAKQESQSIARVPPQAYAGYAAPGLQSMLGNQALARLLSGAERPPIQRLCAECDKKDAPIQRMAPPGAAAAPSPQQRTPMAEIKVDSRDARGELEAEGIAERVAGGSPAGQLNGGMTPPPMIQAAPQGDGGEVLSVPEDVAQAIDSPVGGQTLSAGLRAQLEERLGADFSGVRVHAGQTSAALAEHLNARAFTSGNHIWLAAGESAADVQLMAHELVHVVQQRAAPRSAAQARFAQRAPRVYWSLPGGKGFGGGKGFKAGSPGDRATAYIAEDILPTKNPDLYSEVNIPGGNRSGVATGSTGRADLYKASTTIGVNFAANGNPVFLEAHSMLKKTGKKVDHVHAASPAGRRAIADPCAMLPPGPAIARLDTAPTNIEIGDIKPAYEGEVSPGRQQVLAYIAGVKQTAMGVNAFASAHPMQVSPANRTWNPDVNPLNVVIPQEYASRNSSRPVPVVMYVDEKQKSFYTEWASLLLVNVGGGILTYDFIPKETTSSGGSPAGKKTQHELGDKLKTDVKTPVKAPPKREGALLRRPGVPRPPVQLRVQRKATDDFKFASWKKDKFDPWHSEAAAFAGADPLLGRQIKPSTDAQEVERAAGLQQLAKRVSGLNVSVPADAEAKAADLEMIRMWVNHGAQFGRLRQIFGTTFVRIISFYEKVRDRFHNALDSKKSGLGGGSKAGSSLTGAVIHGVIILARNLGRIFLHQVAERLSRAVQNGAKAFIERQFGEQLGEIREFQERLEAFETAVREDITERIEAFIAPFQERIDEIKSVINTLHEISTWVNRAKWIWRVASCGAPPLLGCLWGIFGSALIEAGVAAIVASCWFQRNVMMPVVQALGPIKRLPDTVAAFILDKLRKLLPEPLHILIGQPETGEVQVNPADVPCEPDQVNINGSNQKLIEMFEELGEDKVKVLLAALQESGADGSKPLTEEQAERLKAFMATHSVQDIETFLRHPSAPATGISLDEALDHIDQAAKTAPGGVAAAGPEASVSGPPGAPAPGAAPPPQPVKPNPELGSKIRAFAGRTSAHTTFFYRPGQLKVGASISAIVVFKPGSLVVGGSVVLQVVRSLPGGGWYIHVDPGQPLFNVTGDYVRDTWNGLDMPTGPEKSSGQKAQKK